MDQDLSLLSQEEVTLLKDAFAYIAVLIAGADGKIDKHELDWAEKIAQIRTYKGDERVHGFHEEVNAEIHERIVQFIQELPENPKERSERISQILTGLNPVLAKLDPEIGAYLYKGYVSFATRIARSSGGILSFFTVGPEEKKWIKLPMLTPIDYNPDEEE